MRTDLSVHPVRSDMAQSMSVREHYLHRECPCTQAYGLFNRDGRMVGVCIFGCPSSSTLRKGICGDDEEYHVTELKRLWVEEGIDNFPESFFISQSLKQMKRDHPDLDIIVSYADAGFGHVGVVYQSTNWIYTGTSTPFADWVEEGNDADHLTQADKWKAQYGSAKKAREMIGDRMVKKERSLKHRYVYFNAKCRKRERELHSKLKYPIEPYPKSDSHGHYECSQYTTLDRWNY